MNTKGRQLRRIVADYRESGQAWPATTDSIASWAIQTGRWSEHRRAARRQCAREIGRALREEYYTDSKGRRVRAKHAATKKRGDEQIALWDDIRTAPREHLEVSFQQRRERIVGDCRQLRTDADSYNDAHPEQDAIQLVFDFRQDLAELEALGRLTRPGPHPVSPSPTERVPRGGLSPSVDRDSTSLPAPYPH